MGLSFPVISEGNPSVCPTLGLPNSASHLWWGSWAGLLSELRPSGQSVPWVVSSFQLTFPSPLTQLCTHSFPAATQLRESALKQPHPKSGATTSAETQVLQGCSRPSVTQPGPGEPWSLKLGGLENSGHSDCPRPKRSHSLFN